MSWMPSGSFRGFVPRFFGEWNLTDGTAGTRLWLGDVLGIVFYRTLLGLRIAPLERPLLCRVAGLVLPREMRRRMVRGAQGRGPTTE